MDSIADAKRKGARIAIDDFGTGFSNFIYLKRPRPNILKIYGSLIKDIDRDQMARSIVKSIVDTSRTMNLEVLAEYVHNKTIANIVKALGIEYSQGFYFSEPLPEGQLRMHHQDLLFCKDS